MQHQSKPKELKLNPEQQNAATPKHGVFLVCAGAGSGKTRVITARMLTLMTHHYAAASSIVALTFTNKAAHEMRERILAYNSRNDMPAIGTFHSFCLRLLKTHGPSLGLSEFSMLDDDDQEKLIRSLINRHGVAKTITPKHLQSLISRIKNESVTGIVDFSSVKESPLIQELCLLYEREKTRAHCLDFDDLLLQTLKIFRTNPSFKLSFQARVRHLLVDEYQDTNHVQHALLKAITCNNDGEFTLDSLCAVGDEDQAIYSWRGATVSNIINFTKDFPTATRFTIEQNYRSVQPILDVANTVIENNTERMPKQLWSERQAKDRVRLLTCASGYQEAEIVALYTQLHQARTAQQHQYSLAVLYRSHYQSRALEEALIRHSLPYTIIGGIRFYERQEIKDLFAYARLIANPFDRISLARVINVPSRGLGDKFQEHFFEAWDHNPTLPFIEIAASLIQKLPPSKQAALNDFIECFTGMTGKDNAHESFTILINRSRYLSHLDNAFEPEEATTKKENVKELLHAIRSLEERDIITLTSFLDEVALLQDSITQQTESDNHIRLMTLHAAKGLEFDTIIVTGLEEGILPSNHNLYNPAAIEEERRLLYVGITRAKERLLMTHARYRYTYGTMTDQRASRFLKEVTKKDIFHEDCSSWGASQVTRYLSDWIAHRHIPTPTFINSAINKKENAIQHSITPASGWYLKQKVRHSIFGIGTIQHIEVKEDGQTIYLTVNFSSAATKKIAASFVNPLP